MTELGKFITIEGGEGAGKSTQVAYLVMNLSNAGMVVAKTREPGGTPASEEIRNLLLSGTVDKWDGISELFLFLASRRDHWIRGIKPALDQGCWVVCDRFVDTTLAYQGYGRGLPLNLIRMLNLFVCDQTEVGLWAGPDLTFILDVPVEEGLARILRRTGHGDRFELADRRFHEEVRRGFLEIADRDNQRCYLIDALKTPEAVAGIIWEVTQRRFLDGNN
jgi:dTMP kinase